MDTDSRGFPANADPSSKVLKLIHRRIEGVGRLKVREGGLNLVALHDSMLELLREEGVTTSQYPST